MKNQKTVLITGATSGIGLETAKELIEKGFFVIGTSRSDEKEKKAIRYLGINVVFIKADLSSQESIRTLSKEVKSTLKGKGLDVIINNAGSFYSYYSLSEEGIEKQFAINTIAPFYLSLLLYSDLCKVSGRIINVSSSSHYGARINWSDLQLSRNYGQLKAYKQTKLMSVMITKKFNELSNSVKGYMADPGLVNTEIGFKNTGMLAKFIWKYRKQKGQPPHKGAETSIYLSCEESLPNDLYFKDCLPKAPNKTVENNGYVNRVWDYCQKVAGVNVKEIIMAYDK